jgi:dephospho-CoA kinase
LNKQKGTKMKIENNVLKHYLKNVYFITGTAYAGKSTTVKMLAERYDMVCCGENYHMAVSEIVATPETHPDLCYNKSLTDWREFVTRTPEEYERWMYAVGREAAEFEVAELIAISQDKKVIVDTNIPLDILKEISDYNHVAVMLSPQSMSVERFFDRADPEKQFLLGVIDSCDHPEAVMENYRKGLERINSQEHYDEYANSGFFTVVREDNGTDTREQVCDMIAKHFGLME